LNRGSISIPRCFGVLGDPVAHSRSPILHAAAFAALGLPHRYLAFEVPDGRLASAVRGAAALGFGGLNLTVPHKQAAVSLCDRLSHRAARIGAVNTLRFVPDAETGAIEICGHNTDARGFLDALAELFSRPGVRAELSVPSGDSPALRHATVLGAGGASLAVVDALLGAYPQLELTWVSRVPEHIPVPAAATARVRPLAWEQLGRPRGELLVNTTTVGLAGGPEAFPITFELDALEPHARVIDLVYSDPQLPRSPNGLLDRAALAGFVVQDGLPMLHWQAVRALELWLEQPMPEHVVAAMRHALYSTSS
jgi:shikimate dehydrogenase